MSNLHIQTGPKVREKKIKSVVACNSVLYYKIKNVKSLYTVGSKKYATVDIKKSVESVVTSNILLNCQIQNVKCSYAAYRFKKYATMGNRKMFKSVVAIMNFKNCQIKIVKCSYTDRSKNTL